MIKYVLDASALLALINKEDGWEKVMAVLPESVMSAVNLSECGAVLYMIGLTTEEIVSLLTDLMPHSEPFDSKQAFLSAELRNATKEKGLSLGDRACLSLSKTKQLTAITADKVWKDLKCGINIECIR